MAEYRDYESLKDVVELKNDDFIYFGKLKYVVYPSFLGHVCGDNGDIFTTLDITDKYDFCANVYGYISDTGAFPDCHIGDYQALACIARALMVLYEEKFGKQTNIPNTPESLFKVGDKVTILPQYLPGTDCNSYRLLFYSYMLKFGDKPYTISDIVHGSKGDLSNDPHYYYLDGISFCFSPEMFEETYKKSPYSATKKQELIRNNTKPMDSLDLTQDIPKEFFEKFIKELSSKNYSISAEPEIKIQINKKHYTI